VAITHAREEERKPILADPPSAARKRLEPAPVSSTLQRYSTLARLTAVTDAACVAVALVTAFLIRYGTLAMPVDYATVTLCAPLVWVAVFHASGTYYAQRLSEWEEFRRILTACSVATILAATASFWWKSSLSREWIALTWAIGLTLELLTRGLWRRHLAALRRSGKLSLRTLVIGTNPEGARLAATLADPQSGFLPVGHVACAGEDAGWDTPILGTVDALPETIAASNAECLFIVSSAASPEEIRHITRSACRLGLETRVSTSLPEMMTSPLAIHSVPGAMALALRSHPLKGMQSHLKRAFDLTLTTAIVLPALPLLAAIGLAVKLSSPGPVLFRQRRVTRGGREFMMLKFRTMREGADQAAARNGIDTSAPFFKLGEQDPRITSVGRVLRRLSLDELPQLFNVLRGDMSLVGPRPLPADQVAANAAFLAPRHEVPAGLSGWWQVHGRSDVSPEASMALDMFYIDNWSLSLDAFILLRTFAAVVSGRGAY
jgi:exopolysaccharide biosynthesis polyprenyl glycosylphosphotransferase